MNHRMAYPRPDPTSHNPGNLANRELGEGVAGQHVYLEIFRIMVGDRQKLVTIAHLGKHIGMLWG